MRRVSVSALRWRARRFQRRECALVGVERMGAAEGGGLVAAGGGGGGAEDDRDVQGGQAAGGRGARRRGASAAAAAHRPLRRVGCTWGRGWRECLRGARARAGRWCRCSRSRACGGWTGGGWRTGGGHSRRGRGSAPWRRCGRLVR